MATEIVEQMENGNGQEAARKKQKSNILERMRDEHKRVTSKLPPPSSIETLDEELQRYGAEIQVNLDTCRLQWWKMHPSKRVIESVK